MLIKFANKYYEVYKLYQNYTCRPINDIMLRKRRAFKELRSNCKLNKIDLTKRYKTLLKSHHPHVPHLNRHTFGHYSKKCCHIQRSLHICNFVKTNLTGFKPFMNL